MSWYPRRLSWIAAPMPPKPAPTMTTSRCSELMKRTVPYFRVSLTVDYGSSTAVLFAQESFGTAAVRRPSFSLLLDWSGLVFFPAIHGVVGGEQRRVVVLEVEDSRDAGQVDPGSDQLADAL